MTARSIAILLLMSPVALVRGQDAPGSSLQPGMRLIYGIGSSENPPWIIESIRRDTALGDIPRCSVIQLRTSPQTAVETRAWCVRGDSLFAWEAAQQRHRLLRPIGPSMTVTIASARGGSSTFSTTHFERDVRSKDSTTIAVTTTILPTVVTTKDSTGRVMRRLRERYSLSLATAIEGIFEVPDSTAAGGWREERLFRLLRVER